MERTAFLNGLMGMSFATMFFFIHYILLQILGRRNTVRCLWIGVGMTFLVSAVLSYLAGGMAVILYGIGAAVVMLIVFPVWVRLSLPGNLVALVPLYLSYLFLFNAQYLFFLAPLIAAICWMIPAHRRLAELASPRRLPRLRPMRRVRSSPQTGMTLIELLIVVLMMAIFAAGLNYAIQAASRSQRFIQNRLTALEQAETQLARLAARDTSPQPGTYPLDDDLLTDDVATSGQLIIENLDNPALRLARVRVSITEKPGYYVTLEKVLPVHGKEQTHASIH
ncbi:type II secretion system protein [Candidatus Sumerlaeota bacterium]|nr:type II secretion system protein [Candidatus Sumerlaeota bacterium]